MRAIPVAVTDIHPTHIRTDAAHTTHRDSQKIFCQTAVGPSWRGSGRRAKRKPELEARPAPVCACRRVSPFSSKAATYSRPRPPAGCSTSRYFAGILFGRGHRLGLHKKIVPRGTIGLQRINCTPSKSRSLLRRDISVSLAAAPSSTEPRESREKVCYGLSSPSESFRLVNARLDRIANRRSFALHRPAEMRNRDRRAPPLN